MENLIFLNIGKYNIIINYYNYNYKFIILIELLGKEITSLFVLLNINIFYYI